MGINIGDYVLVRTYSAGVHFGILKSHDGTEIVLENTRRLYYWEGAFTLSKVATDGIKSGKISIEIPEILLTQGIEIIPVSDKARKQLEEYPAHTPE